MTVDYDDDLPRVDDPPPVPAAVLPGAAERAHELLLRTEWLDERVAAPSRRVARDLLAALEMLAAERSARVAIQAQRDECVRILERRAGAALDEVIA